MKALQESLAVACVVAAAFGCGGGPLKVGDGGRAAPSGSAAQGGSAGLGGNGASGADGMSPGIGGGMATAGAGGGNLDAGCAEVGYAFGDDCHHSCPIDSFVVIVPADRADDVASVTSAGPCRPFSVTGSAPGLYYFSTLDDGVCQVTVSFLSGAPDFVGSVSIAPNCGPCCLGQPTAQSESIAVPELEPEDASPGN